MRIPRLRPYLASAVVVALACILLPPLRYAAMSPEGGPHPQAVSMLDITDTYLPAIKSSRETAIFAAVPVKPVPRNGPFSNRKARWTAWRTTGTASAPPARPTARASATGCTRRLVKRWFSSTAFREVPIGRTSRNAALHAELRDLVMNQKSFRLVKCSDLPEHGCRVFLFEANERNAFNSSKNLESANDP